MLEVEHESTNDLMWHMHISLLSYLSNVRKRFIQLAQVIIGVHFLQRYFRSSSYTRISQLAHFILLYEMQHR